MTVDDIERVSVAATAVARHEQPGHQRYRAAVVAPVNTINSMSWHLNQLL